ncbi:MAG TPA: diguanylate cyclase [Epsilonproteobacteria bacterium]|nr:diguanylate cyclase [Campylobacterota bacterium]
MGTEDIYYQEEKKHAGNRLTFLILLSFLSFVFFEQTGTDIVPNMFIISLLLAGMLLISLFHYALIIKFPTTTVNYRKTFLILIDLTGLTFLVALSGEHGLYFLPLYVWIVMWSSSSFGIGFFYVSIVASAIAWIGLLTYSVYWFLNYDILIAFAITTFLIPLFYLKYIIRMHEQNQQLTKVLNTTTKDATHDELTGIANRKVYKEEMKKVLKEREFFALFFIDLNKFKIINDTHGHHIGDEVLKEVTRRVQESISDEEFFARLGGDEFVIISRKKKVFLPKFAEKLENDVIGPFTVEGVTVSISLSIGISTFPDDSKQEMMLSKFADDAMYVAKKTDGVYHKFYADLTEEEKTLN